jgi:hypothetical protein
MFRTYALAVWVLGLSASAASADPILTPAYETQLEAWLGQGPLTFTNLYAKAPGDDSGTFHSAVDGQGATFTLFEAVFGSSAYILGGYNPQSWASCCDFNYTFPDDTRTAFIYNLTTGVMQTQRLTSDPFDGFHGMAQTFNDPSFGPTFGGGHDLYVSSNLSEGSAVQVSYGIGAPCGWGMHQLLHDLWDVQ